MAIMLDADVVIRGEKGTFDLNGWLARQIGTPIEMAAITVAELWHGVERATGAHRSKREAFLNPIFGAVHIVPYLQETAYEHARIWARLSAAGRVVGYHDMIVAATAIERGCMIATFNRRHFELIPDLRVVVPK